MVLGLFWLGCILEEFELIWLCIEPLCGEILLSFTVGLFSEIGCKPICCMLLMLWPTLFIRCASSRLPSSICSLAFIDL